MNLEIIHVGLLGTNCYITWDEEKNCVVVDCGGDAQKVAQFIQEKGLTPTHLLLTHGHGDHMGGAADLKELYPQMKIVLDSKDLEMIGDGQKSMSDAVAPYARSFTPDVLVGDGDQLTCGKMEFTVLEDACYKLLGKKAAEFSYVPPKEKKGEVNKVRFGVNGTQKTEKRYGDLFERYLHTKE